MKKIFNKEHLNSLTSLPKEVIDTVREIIIILDENYGDERDAETELGGYINIVENDEDFKAIKWQEYIDLENDAIPEFVDLIKCQDGQVYTNSLILCNNDFGISYIMLLEITPDNLKEYIVE